MLGNRDPVAGSPELFDDVAAAGGMQAAAAINAELTAELVAQGALP